VEPADQIPLASAIQALRHELTTAVEAGQDEKVRFALGDIELEFQVQIARERRANAGIAFWVLSLGAEGSRSAGHTHTVRLSLSPVLASEAGTTGPLIVGSRQARRPD
jgi:hypothetical protein